MSKYTESLLKYMELIELKSMVSERLYNISNNIQEYIDEYGKAAINSVILKARVAEYKKGVQHRRQVHDEIVAASKKVPPVCGGRKSVVFLIPETEGFNNLKDTLKRKH